MKLPVAININTLLFILGGLAIAGPDAQFAANWLAASGIPHVTFIVHMLGLVATACGGLALAMPWLRRTLALFGLATPPGAVAPWNPAKDAGPPVVLAPLVPEVAAPVATLSSQDARTPVLVTKFPKGPAQ